MRSFITRCKSTIVFIVKENKNGELKGKKQKTNSHSIWLVKVIEQLKKKKKSLMSRRIVTLFFVLFGHKEWASADLETFDCVIMAEIYHFLTSLFCSQNTAGRIYGKYKNIGIYFAFSKWKGMQTNKQKKPPTKPSCQNNAPCVTRGGEGGTSTIPPCDQTSYHFLEVIQ